MFPALAVKFLAVLKPAFLSSDGRVRPTWRAILFVPLFVILAFPIVFVTAAVLGPDAVTREITLQMLVQGIAMLAGSLGAAWILLRVLDHRHFRSVGLWFFPGWGRDLLLGLALGAGMNSVVVVVLLFSGHIRLTFAGLPPGELFIGLGWNLLAVTIAATAEEALFRGYFFQRLVEGPGAIAAVLVLSVLFGAVHMGNPNVSWIAVANTILLGAFIAVLYLRTRALWMATGFHIAWNYVMAAVYSIPVSGFRLPWQPFEAEIQGAGWLSGGSYGPEGSVLTTVVGVAGVIWLLKASWLRVSPEQQRELEPHPIERVES